MSIENTLPTYPSLALALSQQAVALTPAEMHGLISGMLCGGSKDNGWQTLVHDLTNEGVAFPQALSLPLQQLHEATQEALENEGFMFQLTTCVISLNWDMTKMKIKKNWRNH